VRVRLGIPRSKNQWILALLGAGVIVGCAVPLVRGVLSLSWPKVDGVITHSREMKGDRAIGVDIGYRYATAGEAYTGARFRFQFVLTARRMRSRDVQSLLGRYRVDEPVKIAVNPRNAADSVLEPGPDYESVIPFLLGAFLLLLGLGDVTKHEPVHTTSASPLPVRPRYGVAKILTLTGMALFIVGAYYVYHGISSTQWPDVEGQIVYSRARGGQHPETLLWYEYYVHNRRYLASNYRNGGKLTTSLRGAEAAAKRFTVGAVVPVFYNPADPQDALLEPGMWWGNFVAPALALLLWAAAWLAKRYAEIVASRNR
jgi:hypothetical protein